MPTTVSKDSPKASPRPDQVKQAPPSQSKQTTEGHKAQCEKGTNCAIITGRVNYII
jgi:hypothetical protein